MRLIRFGRRLAHDTDGQVLLFGVVLIAALVAFMLAIPNGTQVTTQKVRAQTAADAGAFTGSIWLARALNLNATMNVGIQSMYTWMTVLTSGEAMALALYHDSLDKKAVKLGQEVTTALFGNHDPVYTSSHIYPQSIEQLAATAQWLYDLQTDVAGSFPVVAQTLGSSQARQNASAGNPLSENPGGMVLVSVEDSLTLATDEGGDNLVLANLEQLAGSLGDIPTGDSDIGHLSGTISIDTNYEIASEYSLPTASDWATLVQGATGGWYTVKQYYDTTKKDHRPDAGKALDSATAYFTKRDRKHHGRQDSIIHMKVWLKSKYHGLKWGPNKGDTWKGKGKRGKNNQYGKDTLFYLADFVNRNDPEYYQDSVWDWIAGDRYNPPPNKPHTVVHDTVAGIEKFLKGPARKHWYLDSSYFVFRSIAGAESTNGKQGPRLRLRHLIAGTSLYAVSYVWRFEGQESPRGLGPAIGRWLFPRQAVAAPAPMLAVARAEPYLAADTTEDALLFAPNWDVRLTPLDSAGAEAIYNDSAYSSNSLTAFNLMDLQKHVLLP